MAMSNEKNNALGSRSREVTVNIQMNGDQLEYGSLIKLMEDLTDEPEQ